MIDVNLSIFFTVWLAVAFGLPIAMVILAKITSGKWHRYLVHYTFNGGSGTSYIIWNELSHGKLLDAGKQIEDKLGLENVAISNVIKLEKIKGLVV
jgi:hypothetical protein